MNLLQIKDFQTSNEILFVLDTIKSNSDKSLSKLGLQKILYLAKVLEPIKDVIISTIEFLTEKRGPYSKDIQNTVDHLTALDYVSIEDFRITTGKNSIAFYQITSSGEQVVQSLQNLTSQEEKYWWIGVIARLSIHYSEKTELEDDSQFQELDKIVRLVYQDPSYNQTKQENNFKYSIDFEDYSENSTNWLISFVKDYIEKHNLLSNQKSVRGNAELITIAFFEYYFLKYLKSIW